MTVDFSTLPAWVNKAFYPLWFDRNRFIVCKGGAGSGKSVDAHRRIIYRMIAEPGHNCAIVRKVGRTLSISCIPLIRQCISDWNLWPLFAENKSNQTVTCTTNGN
jgi:phage terminase large subunit